MLVIVMVVIVAINVPSEPQSASGDRAGRTSRPGRNQGGAISRLSLGGGGEENLEQEGGRSRLGAQRAGRRRLGPEARHFPTDSECQALSEGGGGLTSEANADDTNGLGSRVSCIMQPGK